MPATSAGLQVSRHTVPSTWSDPGAVAQDLDCKEAGLHQPSHSSKARPGVETGLSRRQQWEQEEQQRLQLEVQELERQAVVAEAAVAAVAQVRAGTCAGRQLLAHACW